MSVISMKQLLEAGVHFGHQTRRWNPKMAPYIYTERNGIHIIDLQKSVGMVDTAYKAIADVVAEGGSILFVGTKKQAQDAIKEEAQRCGMYYVNERWLGGMLTNFQTIRKAVKKMDAIDKMSTDGTLDTMSKRERLQISRQREKLELNLGSISDMTRIPAAIFVVDVMKEHIAVSEANKLGIPVFGIVDTNSDPTNIDFVIPCNDDATKAIDIILSVMVDAIKEGRQEMKMNKAEEDTPATIEVKGERRARARRTRRETEGSNEVKSEGNEE